MADSSEDSNAIVIGFGAVCRDIIVEVARFPGPDEKVRTSSAISSVGGCCANCLCDIRRVCPFRVSLVSFVGSSPASEQLLREVSDDFGVDVSNVVRVPYEKSTEDGEEKQRQAPAEEMMMMHSIANPFTYVIVAPGTRACIHTPLWASVENTDVRSLAAKVLQFGKANFYFFDGRYPGVFRKLLPHLETDVPLVFNYEKTREAPELERPFFDRTDVLVLNGKAPLSVLEREEVALSSSPDSPPDLLVVMKAFLLQFARIRIVVVTLGKDGSMMMTQERRTEAEDESDDAGVPVARSFDDVLPSETASGRDLSARTFSFEEEFSVIHCSSAALETVVDSTGAGDAFNAGLLFGLVTFPNDYHRLLSFANFCGSRKCMVRGAVLLKPSSETSFVEEWEALREETSSLSEE